MAMAFTFTLQSLTFLSQNPNFLSSNQPLQTPQFISFSPLKPLYSFLSTAQNTRYLLLAQTENSTQTQQIMTHLKRQKIQHMEYQNGNKFISKPQEQEKLKKKTTKRTNQRFSKPLQIPRQELVKQGLLKQKDIKESSDVMKGIEELEPEEVVDLEEIDELTGLTVIDTDSDEEGSSGFDVGLGEKNEKSFDLDFDSIGKVNIVEPKFKMSLAELLDESKVVPVSVLGDLEVEITGIQDDSRVVSAGDLFICLPFKEYGCDWITGTNGKTTTANLVKGMYEAMGLRTGMLSTVAYYIHGDHKLEAPNTSPGAILVQNLMAKMLHNGTEAVVMEATSQALALGRCDEVDIDIAVFTNLTRDHLDFHGTEEEYRNAKLTYDPNAPFFIAQGNQEVPVVTFAMENKNADVHPLKFELSLFETQVLVNTPHGILEISSGLLGKHNIYNILAAVAVGIAVGAPLEDIVRGIEEIDAVPGRCELIDEEQAFGVIVDYAHTPDALSRLLDSVRELRPKRIITGDKKEFFDDREECREALQYVDELHQAGIDTSEFPWRLPESH
ncbi:UDP-N-acetylmuramoyl-L-alanyl-D-glutamate--2,6-diaminopimelate [Salix suchowensis]|nr:UDP-N-acetylmuramoyl-L-alanyl-D-glutamate--2,6-diaminopimelate [Salix suchowensis]